MKKMKKTKKICTPVLAFLVALGMNSKASAGELSGKDIARRARDANRSNTGVVVKGTLVLNNLKNAGTQRRSFVTMTSRNRGLSRSLFRFTSSSYRGTTFLTIERRGRSNLQYLYLKSVGSPRQVESSDREKNFVDTDLSNEDMGGAKIEDYTYKRLADRKIAGKNCYVIEKYPKSRSSKFSRHLVIIDKSTFVPVASKGYNRAGRVIKTMRAKEIRRVGSVHVPYRVTVTDISQRHRTTMKVTTAKEKRVNRGYFNKNRLRMRWSVQ